MKNGSDRLVSNLIDHKDLQLVLQSENSMIHVIGRVIRLC